jgi:hypothetical protein
MWATGPGGQASQRRHGLVTVATYEDGLYLCVSASAHSRRIEFLLRGRQNRLYEALIMLRVLSILAYDQK